MATSSLSVLSPNLESAREPLSGESTCFVRLNDCHIFIVFKYQRFVKKKNKTKQQTTEMWF